MPDLAPGDPAVLRNAPGPLRRWRGASCCILAVEPTQHGPFARIRVDDGGDGVELRDIPLPYLSPAPAEKPTRRGVLNLHEPRDDRSEEEKQAEGVRFLRELGYRVTVTGKRPEPATCTACTAEEGHPVITLCPKHRKPVFSRGAINNAGLSDLLVTHPMRWGSPGRRRPSVEIEYKKDEKAARKPAQEERAAEGVTAFVW